MTAPKPSATHASVVALKLRDFAQRPVSEQEVVKTKLERAMVLALVALSPDERIVLEFPGGAAVVVLGNPLGALEFAQRAANTPGVATGINHGPVRVIEAAPEPLFVGDGISAAGAIAELAPHGRLVAAREFREALRAVAPDRARHFAPAGHFTDAQDRSHELLFADAAAFASQRREFLASNALLFAAIVGAGVVGRMSINRWRLTPATIAFDVRPWGEVFIDGALKGRSPPLSRVALAAGPHSIELRHPDHPAFLVEDVAVDPGEMLLIEHRFGAPPRQAPQRKPAWQRFLERFK